MGTHCQAGDVESCVMRLPQAPRLHHSRLLAPSCSSHRSLLTWRARSGVHSVCLLGLKPVELISRWRWMASMGMRSMGSGTFTCRDPEVFEASTQSV